VDIATMVEKVVREFPEVETVVTKIGRPDLATEAMGIYQGDVYVLLKPHDEWTTAKTKEELIEAFDERLKEIPGVVYNFTQPLAMRLDEVISGVRSDVAVKLFGDDPERLEQEAEKIQRVLARIPGSADVQVEALSGAGELRIELNRAEMARYGLRVQDVGEVVETAIGGKVATEVIDGRRRFDVVVRLPEERRKDVDTIRALLLSAPGGERVPLGRVARLHITEDATSAASSPKRKPPSGATSRCRRATTSPGAASLKTSSGPCGDFTSSCRWRSSSFSYCSSRRSARWRRRC
jgi:cobalt-zinc-cadmium resistance protein CzcA